MKNHFKDKFDKSGMNLVEFPLPGTKVDIGSVMQAVQTPPFIGEKRMVVVRNLASSLTKPLAKPWVEALKKVPDSTIIIFQDDESVKKFEKRELYKQFQGAEGNHSYPYPEMSVYDVQNWARQESSRLKLNIYSELLNQVVAMVGVDLYQLSGELKKLTAFSNGSAVTSEAVSDLVKANFEDQMFVFIDAIGARDKKKALQLLEEQRESGSPDMHLFGMLARQIRLLVGVRSILDENPSASKSEVANIMGIHPFVAQKTLGQARTFDSRTLKGLHTMLYKFDRGMKRGQIKMDVAVDRFVVQMLG